MKPVVVGVSDCRFSGDPETTLVTYALGRASRCRSTIRLSRSAVCCTICFPNRVCMDRKPSQNPSCLPIAGSRRCYGLSRKKGLNPRRTVVKLAGGASVMDGVDMFEIGKRNYLAAKKILWKEGLFISGEAVGGSASRTVRLDVETGKFFMPGSGAGGDVRVDQREGRNEWDCAF